jgi:2-oxoglutarate ferredoxin oxidoreductase subunit alpha
VHWYTGDEHNEVGHISEEPANRDMMVEKRMRKLKTADRGIPMGEKLKVFGDEESENLVVSWGSPKGAILEAMNKLTHEGLSLKFLQIRMMHPLPKEHVAELLKNATKIITVEIIREKTGIQTNFRILKFNGRPITTTEVYGALKKVLLGQAPERQVLTYGS